MNFSAYLIVTVLAASTLAGSMPNCDTLRLQFFGSSSCGECREISETVLKPAMADHPGRLDILLYDIEDSNSVKALDTLEKKFSVTEPSPQELFFPDTFLLGYDAILKDGARMIEEHLRPRTTKSRLPHSCRKAKP